jgi:hypothetical protein
MEGMKVFPLLKQSSAPYKSPKAFAASGNISCSKMKIKKEKKNILHILLIICRLVPVLEPQWYLK